MFHLREPIPKPASQKNLHQFSWLMFGLLIALPAVVIPTFIALLFIKGGWLFYGSIVAVVYSLCILSIGVYHRYWTHKSFEFKNNWAGQLASKAMRLFGAIFGSIAGQGDAISWVLRHWKHHLVEDKPGQDHHTPLEFKSKWLGFLWSHVGWMCYINVKEFDYKSHSDSKRKELESDAILRWQQKHYVVLYTFSALILPTVLACLFSSNFWMFVRTSTLSLTPLMWEIGMMILAINTARFLCQHATFLVNSLCHMQGEKPYQNHKTGQAHDNWLVAILVFGEGFHNGHHAFGYSYEHGLIHDGNQKTWRAKLMYCLDIHARVIDLMSLLGLIEYKLKPSDSEIKMAMQKRILFDLEKSFNNLSLELSAKKEQIHGQMCQEFEALKEKVNLLGDEYMDALELLIERLKSVIQTCKAKAEMYQETSKVVSQFWLHKMQKAEKELAAFKMELTNLQTT